MNNLTRQQSRQIDELAINRLGIPGVVLMENAGRNATDLIQAYMIKQGRPLNTALILCGGGNNGGDGYVVARHLHNRGVSVSILATRPVDQLTGDAAINATICQNMGLLIEPIDSGEDLARNTLNTKSDLIVDALLGTGFQGELRPDMQQLISAINATRDTLDALIIAALDLPSGLDCDTGRPPVSRQGEPQHAVIADLTVTFVAPKLGFSQPHAWPYLGRFEVADIGISDEWIEQVLGV